MQLKEVYAPSVWQAFWADVPLIAVASVAWCLTHIELYGLDKPRADLALTCIFPTCLLLAVYLLRWGAAAGSERLAGLVVVVGTAGALAFDAMVPGSSHAHDDAAWRQMCETGIFVLCGALLVHAWTRGGWPRVMLFIGPVAVYGALWGFMCVSGGFVSDLGATWVVPGLAVPAAALAGWVVLFYVVTWISWTLRHSIGALRRSALASALIAAGAAVLLELQVEPLATALGLWRWHNNLVPGPMGTPQLAFWLWVCAVIPMEIALFTRERAEHLMPGGVAMSRHRRWIWVRIPMVLMAALALFLGGLVLCEGPHGPSLDILRHAVLGPES